MVALTFVAIVLARVADVSLGTLRTIVTIQGRRSLAFVLSFFELLIWVFVVSRVIQSLSQQPIYGVAYALGFSLGSFIGMTLERRLALGRQIVRVISRDGPEMARVFREDGLRVTQFDGYGRDGPVQELFIEMERRRVARVLARARELDPKCYYMVDDVRMASSAALPVRRPIRWRDLVQKR